MDITSRELCFFGAGCLAGGIIGSIVSGLFAKGRDNAETGTATFNQNNDPITVTLTHDEYQKFAAADKEDKDESAVTFDDVVEQPDKMDEPPEEPENEHKIVHPISSVEFLNDGRYQKVLWKYYTDESIMTDSSDLPVVDPGSVLREYLDQITDYTPTSYGETLFFRDESTSVDYQIEMIMPIDKTDVS